MKDPLETSARNIVDRELTSSDPLAADPSFEPEFIDVTEDGNSLIISGVLDDENMK